MDTLPDDMLANVLGRLPPSSLAASRCVRRHWCSVVDARRLLRADLLPLRLDAFFCNGQPVLMRRPLFFARPSAARRVGSGSRLDFSDEILDYLEGLGISGHCNGLVLIGDMVVNPATRQWATLPDEDVPGCYYLVYDPMVSPHSYQVVAIDTPYGMGSPPLEEWPPSPCSTHVFSSKEWRWEERSFVRQGGKAAGTFPNDDMLGLDRRPFQRQAVYFRGALYVHHQNDAVMRIALSDDKYQMVDSPVAGEKLGDISDSYLGKSEKGVYSALLDGKFDGSVWHRFRVWLLDESRGQMMEWVLKCDITVQALVENFHFDTNDIYGGPWIVHHETYEKEAPPAQDDDDQLDDDDDEWDFDNNGAILEATGECDPRVDWCQIHFLGFHPYKEIAFLWIHYIRLPRPLRKAPGRCTACSGHCGRIKYVQQQLHWKPCPTYVNHYIAQTTTWSRLAASPVEDPWESHHKIQSSEMDISNPHFELLPKQRDDEGRPVPPFKRLSICQPTLSLEEGDGATVCFMFKIDILDEEAWVIAVDMKNNRLQVVEFDATRTACLGSTYLHGGVSRYLDRVSDNSVGVNP